MTRSAWSRLDTIVLSALIVGLLISLFFLVHPWFDAKNDAALYIVTARAIGDSSSDSDDDVPAWTLPHGGLVLEELEKSLLIQALERTAYNQTRAGKLLGINRDQVRYRLEKFGIKRREPGCRESPWTRGRW